MKEQIEHTLKVLTGMPLWSIGRAGSLEWFHFGSQRRTVTSSSGGTKIVGEYALHVECAWRIIGPGGIVVASRDRLYPAGNDPYKDLMDFEWDKPDANRCDERVSMFLDKRMNAPLIVEAVQADLVGSLRLVLSDGYALEVFPDDTVGGEYWRFFQPSMDTDHFVFTGHGFET